jgi:hypothetical protein
MAKKRNQDGTRGASDRKARGAGNTRARRTRTLPPSKNWAWLDALSRPLDPDMVKAALEQPTEQDRPNLDKLFPM